MKTGTEGGYRYVVITCPKCGQLDVQARGKVLYAMSGGLNICDWESDHPCYSTDHEALDEAFSKADYLNFPMNEKSKQETERLLTREVEQHNATRAERDRLSAQVTALERRIVQLETDVGAALDRYDSEVNRGSGK